MFCIKKSTKFADLKFGEYAISVFHDIKMNGKVDTNFMGIPKDGVGVSYPFGFSKMGKPDYNDAKFIFNKNNCNCTMTINCNYIPMISYI